MLMSVVSLADVASTYPEIAGARVLVTGLTPAAGVDLARAFADHKARLVLQTAAETPELTELAALLAQTASDIRLFTEPLDTPEAAHQFARSAAAAYGGLDAAINIVTVARRDLDGITSRDEIEAFVSKKLRTALELTRVAANRMRLTLGTGLVLNVVVAPSNLSASEAALVGLLRTALAAMTRAEAEAWANQAIRINAIGPRAALPGEPPSSACLTSEPDMAALALHLASKKGRQLTGHVFDAEGVAGRGC
jgi:3-oxoacyl-[acyl-carrier protein] reductase